MCVPQATRAAIWAYTSGIGALSVARNRSGPSAPDALAATGSRTHHRMIQDYPSYVHPPNFALLISRPAADPALPMMTID